jgi:hypothetical protein
VAVSAIIGTQPTGARQEPGRSHNIRIVLDTDSLKHYVSMMHVFYVSTAKQEIYTAPCSSLLELMV